MPDEKPKTPKTPAPYVSFKTFENTLEKMEEGLPTRIDRQFLSNLPGSTQSMLLTALRSLSLIDADKRPSPRLKKIVDNPEMREASLKKLVEDYYADALKLGLNAAQSELEEVFTDTYDVTGSTRRKAIAFFLQAAKAGDVQVSRYFKTPKVTAPGSRKRKKKTTPPKKPDSEQERETETPADEDNGFGDLHPFIVTLLEALPEIGSEWSRKDREEWTTFAQSGFNMLYELPPDDKGGGFD